MSSAPAASHLCFDIKSAQWPLVALQLRTGDLGKLEVDWTMRFGAPDDFFDHDPLLIDLTALPADEPIDFTALIHWLNQKRLRPIAYKGGNEAHRTEAQASGLAAADDARALERSAPAETAGVCATPTSLAVASAQMALVIDKPLRSGQQVYARGRDLIVTAMVNPGAEVVADGHIHVYAPLRGKAIAGARGDVSARIFARMLEAELVSIAGVYRTSEVPLPQAVWGKAAQIRLDSDEQGDRLVIEPIP